MTIIQKPLPDHQITRLIREALPFISLKDGPWVAGGAVRRIYENDGIHSSDIDVFFPNQEMQKWAVDLFDGRLSNKAQWSPVYVLERRSAPMSVTFDVIFEGTKFPIQFISKKYFPSMEAILDDFDFTVCMWGTDGENMFYDERAPIDLASRSLVLHQKPKRPKPNRLAKYVCQGFVPSPGVLPLMMGTHILADWYQPERGLVYDHEDNY